MENRFRYISTILLIIVGIEAKAQTCCSGGTPLIGNLGIQSTEAKSWYFQLSYDYNFLDDLYSGTTKLNDQSRERLTQSVLFQGIYAVSDKFSVNGLFSYVDQRRTIFSPTGSTNVTSAGGLGDVVILAQYTPVSTLKRNLVVAFGPKLPVGQFDAVDPEFGLTLAPDLQPGTGSLDGIVGASYQEFHLLNSPGLTLNASIGYRFTTPAERFEGDFQYRFGNEMIVGAGIQKSFLVNRVSLTPSVSFSYRNTSPDKVDGSKVPGTGGNWININPGFSIEPSNYWALTFSGELPVYRNLQGTQLTTSYRFNVGLAFKLFNNK